MNDNCVNESNDNHKNIAIKEELSEDSKTPLQFILKEEAVIKIEPENEDPKMESVKLEIPDEDNCKPQFFSEHNLIPYPKANIPKTYAQKKNLNPRKRLCNRKRYRKSKCRKIDQHTADEPVCRPIQKNNVPESPTCIGETSTTQKDNIYYYNSSSEDRIEEYVLTISNLPKSWSFIQIKSYIDSVCGSVDVMEMLKSNTQYGSIRLFFQTVDECKDAMTKLADKEIEGTKLVMKMEVFNEHAEKDEPNNKKKRLGPDIDVWEDPDGLYGLKPQFLNSLGIKPPLDEWVQVSNFRCDKSELRDVMELAGQVLMCTVITITDRYAKVMYSHPLEAVQAVSMLNGQTFYGKTLKVVMDRCPNDTTILPKGLANIGLGLGEKGRPLRNVLKHYKRYVKKQSSQINPLMFTEVAHQDDKITTNTTKSHSVRQEELVDGSNPTESQIENLSFRVKNVEELNNCEPDNGKKEDVDTTTDYNFKDKNKSKQLSTAHSSNQSESNVNVKQIQTNIVVSSNNQSPTVGSNIEKSIMTSTNEYIPRTSGPVKTPSHSINLGFISGSITSRSVYSAQNSVPQNLPGLYAHNFNPGQIRPRPPMGPSRPAPMIGPMGPGPMISPMGHRPPVAPMGPIGPRPPMGPGSFMRPGGPQPMGPVTVHISNLPLSTTFKFLTEKLNQCGQVVSLQFTTPGCAVAGFAHRTHAERCFQQLNRLHVEGCVIEVKFI